ncbi:MAG: putative rane protein YngC [Candidatus Parcubacteria bacterium]|jgi:membrane protein DedA with SNARE-associated domain
MMEIFEYLQAHIIPLGAWGVFWACMIEEIITPIPSALIMMSAGFIFLKGTFSLSLLYTLIFTVVIPATIGVTLGSYVIYAIGYFGGKPAIQKWGKFFGVSWESVEHFQEKRIVRKTETIALLVARATPFVPSTTIAFFCGFIRQPLWLYTQITFIGVLIRSIILALLGWYAGEVYATYANAGSYLEAILFWIPLGGVVIFVVYRRYQMKRLLVPLEAAVTLQQKEGTPLTSDHKK